MNFFVKIELCQWYCVRIVVNRWKNSCPSNNLTVSFIGCSFEWHIHFLLERCIMFPQLFLIMVFYFVFTMNLFS